MKKRYIIVIVCLIILSSGLALFLNYANQPKTIENQISDELGVEEDSIKFFDEQEYGQYRIVGFEYTTETSSDSGTPCVLRGGYYSRDYFYTSSRGQRTSTNYGTAYSSFRPILYL